jgi:tRNA pseudouridine55 synthase
LGSATVTDDSQGEVISTADVSKVTDQQINDELTKMRGTILQRPSSVSAVKIDGERAYNRVRSGEDVVLPAREVTISTLEIKQIRRIDIRIEIDIEVTCSAGTFIRAIARDCGAALGVGGHLNSLRRTRIAGFGLERAITLDQLKS